MLSQLNFIESNISLKEKSYYKMGGIARYFALPKNLSEIEQTISFAKAQKLPIAILGSGSNCVFSDDLFDGVVIALEKLSSWWWESDEILFAEGGVTNTEIAEICLDAERNGASWMYRMPGQLGASVRMNARCYGGEMSQIVKEILTIDSYGHLNTHDAKKILIGYKNTLLMNTPEIVVGVRFHLPNKGNSEELLKHMKSCEQDRHSKQHFLFPSCGSTFKNNYSYGKPSGRIFDELGLKGTQRGDAEVSVYHGNFVWNKKEATSKDMLNLSAFMRSEAKEKLGIVLDLEVQPVGSFHKEEFESCGMENLGPYIQCENKYLTGLFYTPMHSAEHSLPMRIFSSFFMNYFHEKIKNLPDVHVEILQLQSVHEAKKNSIKPFLRWTTLCQNIEHVFPLKPNSMKDCEKLWEFSVSEIFLAHPNKAEYLECEMTPDGHALKLNFSDIRKLKLDPAVNPVVKPRGVSLLRDEISSSVSPHKKPTPRGLTTGLTAGSREFSMEFCFDDLKDYITNNTLRIQCALSLGNSQYFLAPYWEKDSKNKADFHQPAQFWNLNLI